MSFVYERWCHRIPLRALDIRKVKKFVKDEVKTGSRPETVGKRLGVDPDFLKNKTDCFETDWTYRAAWSCLNIFELSATLEHLVSAIWNSQHIIFQFSIIKQKCFTWLWSIENLKLWRLTLSCEQKIQNHWRAWTGTSLKWVILGWVQLDGLSGLSCMNLFDHWPNN